MSGHIHRRHRSPLLIPGILLALVLALGGGFLAWQAVSDPTVAGSAEAGCEVETVDVAVTPRMHEVVVKGLDAIETECLTFAAHERSATEVSLSVGFGGGRVPSLWVGDTRWEMDSLIKGGVPLEVRKKPLASTPVLLVGAAGSKRPASWGDALSTRQVTLPDPLSDSVGALALASAQVEARGLGRSEQDSTSMMVPTAQRYGELAASGIAPDLSLDTLQPGGPRVVVTTEQELVKTAGKVAEVTPRTGPMMLDFPLALPASASEQVRGAADDLEAWFASEAGAESLAEAGLRAGDHTPLAEGRGVRSATFLRFPKKSAVDADLAQWRVISAPSSILAVIDVSGSMDFPAPEGGTRIGLTVDVARAAMYIFPGHARVGLWAFSIEQDGRNDYRVLQPLRRLDAKVGGTAQRDLLLAQADLLPSLTRGGTGLNDTTLAAYRSAVKDYDPNYSNSVILITDGSNDDDNSISQRELLDELKAAYDPARPVRIVAIGVTKDADMDALATIAEATGGNAYLTNTPQDILGVFSQEIANR